MSEIDDTIAANIAKSLGEIPHPSLPKGSNIYGSTKTTRDKTNHYVTGRGGGRDIDLRAFASQGMELFGRMLDIRGEHVTFGATLRASLDAADRVAEGIKDAIDQHIAEHHIEAPPEDRCTPVWVPARERTALDLAAAGITSVVWSIGYRSDYRWVQVGVFDAQGHPRHVRGVTAVDGLYFLGLPWLHTWGSGRFAGVARDAEYLAGQITGAAHDHQVAPDHRAASEPKGDPAAARSTSGREHALL